MLARHDLLGTAEQPFAHTGFSGAPISLLVRGDGARFVLKRIALEHDWIMRATNDTSCREALFAACDIAFPPGIQTPAVGVARSGSGHALLMRDITLDLLPPGPINEVSLRMIIERMAALHAVPVPSAPFPWCGLAQRLALLTPAGARIAASYGAPVARDLIDGWSLFDRLASRPCAELLRVLFDDVSPLVRALAALPLSLLHGDLKLDNIGLTADGGVWLIDWAMTLLGPTALELGWFLAINSRRLPLPLDKVMALYADVAALPASVRTLHDDLTVLCGLLLRGWRKALDADAGEQDELRWWCARAQIAGRRLAM